MKFIRIENVILNTAHITSVFENLEEVRKPNGYDLPFDEYENKVSGIRVVVTSSADGEYFVFKSETLDSFYKKLGAMTQKELRVTKQNEQVAEVSK